MNRNQLIIVAVAVVVIVVAGIVYFANPFSSSTADAIPETATAGPGFTILAICWMGRRGTWARWETATGAFASTRKYAMADCNCSAWAV